MIYQRLKKINFYLYGPFIVLFELVLIARMVSLYYLVDPRLDSLISWTLVGLSIFLMAEFFIERIKNKAFFLSDILLSIFLIVLFVSMLVNRGYGIFDNLKLIMWQGIYFFAVFELGRRKSKRLLVLFESVLIAVWFLLVMIAVVLFITKFSNSFSFDKLYYGVRLGIVENRLYGVFVDPNYASTISLITIISSFHLFTVLGKNKLIKSFLVANIFFQFSYIILSGSRSAQIQLVIAVLICTFFFLLKSNRVKKYLNALILSILAVFLVLGSFQILKQAWVWTANSVKIDLSNSGHSNELSDSLTLSRNDVDNNSDVSNSRFKLWKSSLEIFENNPIFGTSPKNLYIVAQEQTPKTYIAVKEQTSHNFLFYLLATTGIMGTIPILIFLIINAKTIFSRLLLVRDHSDDYFQYLFLSLVGITVLISACLVTDMVLVNRLAGFIFWFFAGYLQNSNTLTKK
ncbi:polymerase [Enterococcus florum]|uniref:Polymerase n=1 Tax=Enterococcus florum TaxID=2480627 RepID=A0A4P5P7U7_9ENTE|nr:O-antigen ligase family protein [Enterococcus florum]GCF93910.1 polymerase [Enterococcus florum]